MNILGTFDQIYAAKMPVVHPSCAIALRMRFDKMEEGSHKVNIQLVDPDGHPVFQPMEVPIFSMAATYIGNMGNSHKVPMMLKTMCA